MDSRTRYTETIRHHLLIALGSAVMATGRYATDEMAKHIKAAIDLLPDEPPEPIGERQTFGIPAEKLGGGNGR